MAPARHVRKSAPFQAPQDRHHAASAPEGARKPGAARRFLERHTFMDIERINAIGGNLDDLTERTLALRGYL